MFLHGLALFGLGGPLWSGVLHHDSDYVVALKVNSGVYSICLDVEMSEFQTAVVCRHDTFIMPLKAQDNGLKLTSKIHRELQSSRGMIISAGFGALLAFLLLLAAPYEPLSKIKAGSTSHNYCWLRCVRQIQVSRHAEATTTGLSTFAQNNVDIVQG